MLSQLVSAISSLVFLSRARLPPRGTRLLWGSRDIGIRVAKTRKHTSGALGTLRHLGTDLEKVKKVIVCKLFAKNTKKK